MTFEAATGKEGVPVWSRSVRFDEGASIFENYGPKSWKLARGLKCEVLIRHVKQISGHTVGDSSYWREVSEFVSECKNEDFDNANATDGLEQTALTAGPTQTQTVRKKKTTTYSATNMRHEVWSMMFTVKPLSSPGLNRGQWKGHFLILFEDEIPKGIRCGTLRAVTEEQFLDEIRTQKRVEVESDLLERLDFSLTDGMDGKVWKCKSTLFVAFFDKRYSLDD